MVRQLVNKGIGPRRLDQELRSRGIKEAWQACADLADLQIDWGYQAQQVYEKKISGTD